MSRKGLISLCVALLAGGGCATPGELPRQSERDETSVSERAAPESLAAPLVVDLRKTRDVAPGEVELELVLQRKTSGPVSLEIQLPAGAELVDGVTRETLNDPARRIVKRLRLRLPEGTPADDVRVIADAHGTGYGARASAAYRFGRPAPKLVQPTRSDTASIANGKRLGKPIPLQ
jgi:hypothetical protein